MPTPANTLDDAGGTELLSEGGIVGPDVVPASVFSPAAVSENDAIDDNPMVVESESAGATAIDGVGFDHTCGKFLAMDAGLISSPVAKPEGKTARNLTDSNHPGDDTEGSNVSAVADTTVDEPLPRGSKQPSNIPRRAQPQFDPGPGSEPQTSLLDTPAPSHPPGGVSRLQQARTFAVCPLCTPLPPSYYDVLMGVSALFHLPPTSVGSPLLLRYHDSEGDSCTLTAAPFPDALPLFFPDYTIRLTAATINRHVCASCPSPRSSSTAPGGSPSPSNHANVYTPPRHVM